MGERLGCESCEVWCLKYKKLIKIKKLRRMIILKEKNEGKK